MNPWTINGFRCVTDVRGSVVRVAALWDGQPVAVVVHDLDTGLSGGKRFGRLGAAGHEAARLVLDGVVARARHAAGTAEAPHA